MFYFVETNNIYVFYCIEYRFNSYLYWTGINIEILDKHNKFRKDKVLLKYIVKLFLKIN